MKELIFVLTILVCEILQTIFVISSLLYGNSPPPLHSFPLTPEHFPIIAMTAQFMGRMVRQELNSKNKNQNWWYGAAANKDK